MFTSGKHTPLKSSPRDSDGGAQDLYRFDNGYGASVVDNAWSYGTELAVLKYESTATRHPADDPRDYDNYVLCYDTPVTGNVIGHIPSVARLDALLDYIASL